MDKINKNNQKTGMSCDTVCTQHRLTPEQIEMQRSVLGPSWKLHDHAIEKTFEFKNYYHTIAFVNALVWIAHAENHHPSLHVEYNRCTVIFTTHSAKGLTIHDFICAQKVDAL